LQTQTDASISAELRQVADGCAYKVRSYTCYDVNGYRFRTKSHEEKMPNRKTTNTGVCTPGLDGAEYYGVIEEIYELNFGGCRPLNPVIFKCHWFDPNEVRRTPKLGLVEVRKSSVYAGEDVYIVAQQATQVYYLSYPCTTDDRLEGWDVVYKVSPHGKLPVPNNEDYNFDPNTYTGEFFQEDGLQGSFEIDLTEADEMEVEQRNEDDGELVRNLRDLDLLDKVRKGKDQADAISPPLEHGCEGIEMQDASDDDMEVDNHDYDDYF